MAVDLSARRALVTGASGGLGREIAKALHERGAHVLASGRRTEALDGLADELGGRVDRVPADLSDPAAVAALLDRAGRVDLFVAAAGLPASGRLDTFTEEELDRALAVNLRAPMQLARALVPAMVERGSGHVVFLSSASGKVATPGTAVYAATKFALRGFAFALHEDLLGTGVGVTAVFPGFVAEAGMFASSGVRVPRWAVRHTPRDVADAVLEGIERNRAEIDVAPLLVRAGGWLGGAAPSLVARLTRARSRALSVEFERSQRHRR